MIAVKSGNKEKDCLLFQVTPYLLLPVSGEVKFDWG